MGDKPNRCEFKRNIDLPIKTKQLQNCDITYNYLYKTQNFEFEYLQQTQALIKMNSKYVCAYQSNAFASKM